MTNLISPLLSLYNAILVRCTSLDKVLAHPNGECADLPFCSRGVKNSICTYQKMNAAMSGMERWNSVRLQPELFGAGAFFGLGGLNTQTRDV